MSIVRKYIRNCRVCIARLCNKISAKMDSFTHEITIKDCRFINCDDAIRYEITPHGRLKTVIDIRNCVIIPKDDFSEMTGGRYD